MIGSWQAFLAAGATTFVSAPIVRRVMLSTGTIDVPNHRSSHSTPTARGGGWACILGLVVALIAAASTGTAVPWPVFGSALALGMVGFVDDRRGLGAMPRLVAQMAMGAVTGWLMGGPTLALLGVGLFPLLVNVVNFMDGINGISGVTLAVWGACAVLAATLEGVPTVALVGSISVGIAVGFLPWNLARRLFLGDVGSYLLGALIAGGVLQGQSQGMNGWVLIAPMGVYLSDVLATLYTRWRRGAVLTDAHREHTYQLLANELGLAHALVAGLAAAGSLVIGIVAITGGSVLALGCACIVCASYLFLPILLGPVGPGSTTLETSEYEGR